VPRFDPATWRLRAWGEVEVETSWTWEQLQALPRRQEIRDWHCVTTWSKMDNRWEGVSVGEILRACRPRATATHVTIHSYDSIAYTTNLSMHDFARDENLLCTHHDGQPLAPDHGGPIRLVVHHLYAWKSAKWICGVEFMPADRRGFWEVRGYHNRADPFLEERYSHQEEDE
jgi:DMSO/TMAO reductase YedYZ molybdopterin-dependent catalytic subunit